MKTNQLVEMKNVSKIYPGEVKALDDVSFEIISGEFIAISGPSGSGKTTLLNILGGLDRPSTGEVVINGQNIESRNENQLADFRLNTIGFVFQAFNLLPALNAKENIMLPLLPVRGKLDFDLDKRADELIQIVDLQGREKHLPSQLSGGEMQRVAIARALINNPAIILADEPTGNLDSHIGKVILDLLHHLNRDIGTTIILVSHDPEMIKNSDRVLSIKDGKISLSNDRIDK